MLIKKLKTTNGRDYLEVLNASEVVVDVTNFDNNLSSTDVDLQTALETIDEISASGGETVNVETLTANKTLTASDATIQILQTGSANRIVNLPDGLTIGQKFVIWNNNEYTSSYYLDVKYVITKDKIYSQKKTEFYWDGTNWYYSNESNVAIGNSANVNIGGVAIGYNANGNNSGAVLGYNANGDTAGAVVGFYADGNYEGAAVGYGANGSSNGASVGYYANSNNYGVALGYGADGYNQGAVVGSYANGVGYGVALGHEAITNYKQSGTVAIGTHSQAERNREIVSTASSSALNKAQMTIQKYKETDIPNNTSTWVELFVDASSSRLVLLTNSVYNFFGELNCYRIATNDNILYPLGAVKGWQFTGLIKNVAGVVALVGTPTITLLGCDTDGDIGNVDMQIEADDINDSLKLSVYIPLGSGGQTYRFSGNIFASETRM
jgi:hypothetical protein